ncbi:MAG: hypothetical protein LH473_11600 [Chitinophagales bacterium]|nr:hypothetical protein [Chitinophagales bacterium]
MIKSIIILSIAAFLFAGCAGNQKKENDNTTHQHDDGSVHQHHEEDSTVDQEEFTAPVDTASQKADSVHEHSHDEHGVHEQPHKH